MTAYTLKDLVQEQNNNYQFHVIAGVFQVFFPFDAVFSALSFLNGLTGTVRAMPELQLNAEIVWLPCKLLIPLLMMFILEFRMMVKLHSSIKVRKLQTVPIKPDSK